MIGHGGLSDKDTHDVTGEHSSRASRGVGDLNYALDLEEHFVDRHTAKEANSQ